MTLIVVRNSKGAESYKNCPEQIGITSNIRQIDRHGKRTCSPEQYRRNSLFCGCSRHDGLRGATTAQKWRPWKGTNVWVPTTGRLGPALGQRQGWVLGAGGSRPLLLWWSGGITPGKFVKSQMLHPAFRWLLAVKFLVFLKTTVEKLGTNTLLGPVSRSPSAVAPMGGPIAVIYLNL